MSELVITIKYTIPVPEDAEKFAEALADHIEKYGTLFGDNMTFWDLDPKEEIVSAEVTD